MVSIIIVSYNTKKLLDLCLSSVYERLSTLNFEVIVVDNASVDGTPQMLRSKFKHVIRIENKENVGFARANNMAVRIAKGQQLLFLNSDTKILDQGIEEMSQFLKTDTSFGVVGGALVNKDGTFQKSFGPFFSVWSVLFMMVIGKRIESFTAACPKVKLVDWVSGGFMMIPSELFKKLKGFDEHFFMYVEDMELCLRVQKEKLKVGYFSSARALHEGQGSSNRAFAVVNIYQGTVYFFKKHKSVLEYYVVRFILLCKAVFAIAVGKITGDAYLISTYRKALSVL